MKVVGLELGTRRIGVAASDRSGLLASPRSVLVRSGDSDADRTAIAAIVREEEAEMVVVGLPVSLDGVRRAPAIAASEEAEALAELLGIPVVTEDERLTTVLATRLRRENAGRARRGDRRPVDSEAAAVMLQSWLDARRPPPEGRSAVTAPVRQDARPSKDEGP